MISFIIYAHSFRKDNLIETISSLEKNEPNLNAEIIIVFQDNVDVPISCKWPIKKQFLNIDTYKKPFMCNIGVGLASNDIIVILDSDRILPENYFYNNLQIRPKEIITTKYLRGYKANGSSFIENRSINNEINCKNLFSGNTMMWKCDWFGADESFIGYGSADNDMTATALQTCFATFLDVEERHLYHPTEIIFGGRTLRNMEWGLVAFTNLLRYVKKWKIDRPKVFRDAGWWKRNIYKYPEDLREFFFSVYK